MASQPHLRSGQGRPVRSGDLPADPPAAESNPGAERRIRKALGLAADATELEVLARISELKADGYEVIRRSELERLQETVAMLDRKIAELRAELQAQIGEASDELEAKVAKASEAAHQLLFEVRFSDAQARGRVHAHEYKAWLGAFRRDQDAAIEALNHSWDEAV